MEFTLDLQNYEQAETVFQRTAARGIVRRDDTFLFIYSKRSDYKFPGGGVEPNESLEQALMREVREETGYIVKADSMRYWGVVHERRKGAPEDVLAMDSHYFFCEVEASAGERRLDPYETDYDYQVVWSPLHKAMEHNKTNVDFSACPWVIRETKVMEYLVDYFVNG